MRGRCNKSFQLCSVFFYGDAVSLKSILGGFSALCMINEGVELLLLWFYYIVAVELFVAK